jgi:alkanesulfonate monooxygenase SsuD/methylene tetrahydromethanopterin reductase-like flavin-dependent oxidoreductase (luciferase family)
VSVAGRWGFAVNNFYLGGTEDIRTMMRLGSEVEEAGFDSVWLGDHVLWHTPIVDAIALLGAFTATTERLEIGTAILLLGLRQPGIATKTLTSLNAMSGGRLVLGVGVGGENPAEFEFAGVRHAERGKLLDEALRVLSEQWDAPDSARVEPTGPPPEILIGGRSGAARRRIERFQAGWLASFVSPKRIREEVEIFRTQMSHEVPVALNVYVRTHRSSEDARREAGAFLSRAYAMEEGPLMRYTVAGTPEECAEQLRAYADAGVETFVLRPAAWDQEQQLREWSAELLPLLRSPVGGVSGRSR